MLWNGALLYNQSVRPESLYDIYAPHVIGDDPFPFPNRRFGFAAPIFVACTDRLMCVYLDFRLVTAQFMELAGNY
jgi:hypothetical protein